MANPYAVNIARTDTPSSQRLMQGIGSIIKQNRESKKKEKQQAEFRAAWETQDPETLSNYMIDNPESADLMNQLTQNKDARTSKNQTDTLRNVLSDPENSVQHMQDRVDFLKKAGANSDTAEQRLQLAIDKPEEFQRAAEMAFAGKAAKEYKAFKSGSKGDSRVFAGESDFNALIKDFSPKEKKEARKIKAGLEGRAVGSADQTIADKGTSEKVGNSAAIIKAKIEASVQTARIEAKDRGETLTDLNRAKAGLPGLKKAVENLRELSVIATNTLAGRGWNAIVKETGFGSTVGGTARAKFISTINNQVLPLLKPTFGGSFSVQEGESLKATMGDPNATPEEKMAQLDAFLDQKIRDIEAKETQLQDGALQSKQLPLQNQQNQQSIDDLLNKYGN